MSIYQNLRFEVDGDGIALLTIDVASRSMNVFTPAFSAELRDAVAQIGERGDVRGAVLTSGKSGGFLAGADLKDFVGAYAQGTTALAAAERIALSARTLRDLERCGKPVAAAINGLALGGGYELCLACHHRILLDDPSAVVGLPEVTVGLMPGGGGTQRLPRLIGIEGALPLLLSGRHMAPQEALSLGLVDALAPADRLLAAARRWVLDHPDARQPWDLKGFRVPGGAGALAAHANQSFGVALARVRRETHDQLPAPLAILSAVYEGTQLPIDRGLHVESLYFGPLLAGPVARNLMRTMFVHRGAALKRVRGAAEPPQQPVRRLAVIGAGALAAEIAKASTAAGIEVIPEGALGPSKGCDFVFEAAGPASTLRAQSGGPLADARSGLPADFVLASSASPVSASALARSWPDPRQVVGLQRHAAVPRMPLMEVVCGALTSRATLARALDFARRLRHTPIVVHDEAGAYVRRLLDAYIDEGIALLAQGVAPALIENAARQAGFAAGPLAAADETSLDALRPMREAGRRGRDSGGGFHDYEGGRAVRLWPGLRHAYPPRSAQPEVEEVRQRLLCMPALASTTCLAQGIVTGAADADLGAVLGQGYPAWTGGTLSYIETVGMTVFVERCERLADRHGERFRPSAALRERARAGLLFHAQPPSSG